jgi:hypothetical protein
MDCYYFFKYLIIMMIRIMIIFRWYWVIYNLFLLFQYLMVLINDWYYLYINGCFIICFMWLIGWIGRDCTVFILFFCNILIDICELSFMCFLVSHHLFVRVMWKLVMKYDFFGDTILRLYNLIRVLDQHLVISNNQRVSMYL